MSGNYQILQVVEPDDSELQLAIRAFSLQEGGAEPAQAATSGADTMQHFLVLLGHASARLDSGALADEAVADLVRRGLDQGTAQVVVDKAVDVVASNRALESAPLAQHVRPRSGKSIRVFAIVLVVVALVVALLVMR
ncbi:MAG: hypothetical protein EOO79_02475 [Oxalobacteraceae bacterium]|nr:MAG: hypothetical protein EOO79_02475 [Oxalobacteraceae bacterium]